MAIYKLTTKHEKVSGSNFLDAFSLGYGAEGGGSVLGIYKKYSLHQQV
jgi:hypothetical protein